MEMNEFIKKKYVNHFELSKEQMNHKTKFNQITKNDMKINQFEKESHEICGGKKHM